MEGVLHIIIIKQRKREYGDSMSHVSSCTVCERGQIRGHEVGGVWSLWEAFTKSGEVLNRRNESCAISSYAV